MTDTVKQAQSIVGTSPNRPQDEFYPTPPEATQALLDNIKFYDNVWEPACGDGAISKVLINNGYKVISTDLYDHGYGTSGIDFLKTTKSPTNCIESSIITNPPYRLAEDFIHHAYKLQIFRLALLLKVTFLAGKKRKKTIFDVIPPSYVLVFSKRLTMTRNGEPLRNGGMIDFAWFVWDRYDPYKTVVSWI